MEIGSETYGTPTTIARRKIGSKKKGYAFHPVCVFVLLPGMEKAIRGREPHQTGGGVKADCCLQRNV